MIKLLQTIILGLTISHAHGQAISEGTTATTLSPFVSVTKLMEGTTVATSLPTLTTALGQRGVAAREQLKDELPVLNDQMASGEVTTIEEVKQPALRELFKEISADETMMDEVNSLVQEGNELHRVATAVTFSLIVE